MRRVGCLMERICAADNLLLAYYEAGKGKRGRDYVQAYSRNLFGNVARLREKLLSGSMEVGRYSYFYVHDPKLRRICAADFEERIMHHAVINICHPYFERNLIFDTYASRIGKGVYAAIDRARCAMRLYAENELRLQFKEPVIGGGDRGVSFLGYTLYPHKILLNRRSKVRFRKKIRKYMTLYESGEWSDRDYSAHITPLLAFTRKAYTKGFL